MFPVGSDELLFLFFVCARQKLPKVNKELALKLMEEGDDDADLVLRKKKGKVRNFIEPSQTQQLFSQT